MRNRPQREKWNALWRARAKAVRGKTTERAKIIKRIDFLNRQFDQLERVQRYYCTEFGFWRHCHYKPCRRARACRSNPSPCLLQSLHRVSRDEIRRARTKLLNAMPSCRSGPVELMVSETWPTLFWERAVNPALLEKQEAEARRRREVAEYLDALWNPYGPDGLAPVRRNRARP
jgi:hypothetical protein